MDAYQGFEPRLFGPKPNVLAVILISNIKNRLYGFFLIEGALTLLPIFEQQKNFEISTFTLAM
jgi:hypothetical protein